MAKKTTTEIEASSVLAPTDGKADYLITELAPSHIAGRRRYPGQTEIRLTEEEALSEVLAGHVWPKDVPRKTGASEGDKTA